MSLFGSRIAEGTPSEWIKCVDMVPGPRDSIFFDRGWDCGWEYSEAESRKSDQNPHLEGGRVFVHIRVKKSTPSLRYKILK